MKRADLPKKASRLYISGRFVKLKISLTCDVASLHLGYRGKVKKGEICTGNVFGGDGFVAVTSMVHTEINY